MSDLLLFGGTTEGRTLAEFCAARSIPADVCVTTGYGAALLPQGVTVHTGKLTAPEMQALMQRLGSRLVIDATHPYAQEATRSIRTAAAAAGIPYLRLLRESVPVTGVTVPDMPSLIARLNSSEGIVLSTLGSKSLPHLTQVRGFRDRLYLRLLPAESVRTQCEALGYPASHILWGKGPFTEAENIAHIRLTAAELLVTKESGTAGGYPEKAAAARQCGISLLTLLRAPETGSTLQEIEQMLLERSQL
ncbi:MAG: precorrin-6A reductase [Oscillospiraceae bacterium]|nr:precorrin-6A reductase [Oscillospiraceae bacterium]